MKTPPRWHRAFDAISQLFNVVFLNGDPNESTSGRSHREGWKSQRWIDAALGDGHCRESYEADVKRAERLVAEHRQRQPTENSYEAV